jgi:hypothetical protein
MPQVGSESTIPALERTKTVHALERVATLIGNMNLRDNKIRGCGLVYLAQDRNHYQFL